MVSSLRTDINEGHSLDRWSNIRDSYMREVNHARTLLGKGSLRGFGEAMLEMFELLDDIYSHPAMHGQEGGDPHV